MTAAMRSEPSLSGLAGGSGRHFGAAVRIDQIAGDQAFQDLVLRDCSSLTPEIALNWDCLEWNKGELNFAPADQLLRFASLHGMEVHGHNLIWDQSTPQWAKAEITKDRDWTLVSDHIALIVGRYADQITQWNVVNEPIDTETGEDGMRKTTFQRAFGSGYVARALREARAHAPAARLIINEYGFAYDNPTEADRRRAFLRLVRSLKKEQAPLDGVGLQTHLDLSKGKLAQGAVRSFLRELADCGVDITITELDVKEYDHGAPLDERDRRVADETRRFLDIALAEPAVRGVVTWGLSDRHSWLTENPSQAQRAPDGSLLLNRGLPYDDQYREKPMYWAVSKSLQRSVELGMAFRGPMKSTVSKDA
jgi:endo-1,4-beta-xylanase